MNVFILLLWPVELREIRVVVHRASSSDIVFVMESVSLAIEEPSRQPEGRNFFVNEVGLSAFVIRTRHRGNNVVAGSFLDGFAVFWRRRHDW